MSEKAGGDNPLGLTLETPIVKFLIAVGAVTFSIPILAWGAFRISRMRKAAARSLKAALRAKAEAEGEEWSDSGSDNSSDSEWDVERAIGEKMPVPRWQREEAEGGEGGGERGRAEAAKAPRGAAAAVSALAAAAAAAAALPTTAEAGQAPPPTRRDALQAVQMAERGRAATPNRSGRNTPTRGRGAGGIPRTLTSPPARAPAAKAAGTRRNASM